MSDTVRKAVVYEKQVPLQTQEAFPTARDRIDWTKSSVVVVPTRAPAAPRLTLFARVLRVCIGKGA